MLPPKYQVCAAARNGPDVKMGEIGARRRQPGGSSESQRVFVQSRCLFQHRDLLRGQQGGEVCICQNGARADCNSLQAGRKQLENVGAWRLPHKG